MILELEHFALTAAEEDSLAYFIKNKNKEEDTISLIFLEAQSQRITIISDEKFFTSYVCDYDRYKEYVRLIDEATDAINMQVEKIKREAESDKKQK